MKQRAIRLLSVFLALLLVVVLSAAWAEGSAKTTTILFTHDLHSHFLPQADGEGGESGGYARLNTALNRERARYPDALTVDGGDFSIGSLIQTLYTTQGAELRTMGAMGYDAAAVGNHDPLMVHSSNQRHPGHLLEKSGQIIIIAENDFQEFVPHQVPLRV